MSQKSIEIILYRQLASYIATPSFMLDSDGSIVYCNKSAEEILGVQFSEMGEVTTNNWQIIFAPKDKHGKTISIERSPLFISSTQFLISHGIFHIINLNGELKHIKLFAIPVINIMDIYLGTIAFFQEIKSQEIEP